MMSFTWTGEFREFRFHTTVVSAGMNLIQPPRDLFTDFSLASIFFEEAQGGR